MIFVKEKIICLMFGLVLFVLVLLVFLLGGVLFVGGVIEQKQVGGVLVVLLIFVGLGIGVLVLLVLVGVYIVQFNQVVVLSLFGKYVGMVKDNGLCWNNFFFSKRKVSQCVCNFESGKLKVNELDGSLIEIVVVIVWQVVDVFEVVYNVDDYESFVYIQFELVLCVMVISYLYDQYEDGQFFLCSYVVEIFQYFKDELVECLVDVGVQVFDVCISYLVYVVEIVQVMLQCQQVNVVIVVCMWIVVGVVGMVEMVLVELQKNGVVQLDEECKVYMVSNLLMVLCLDCGIQLIVNVGLLY